MLLALNVFIPVGNVQAESDTSKADALIISTSKTLDPDPDKEGYPPEDASIASPSVASPSVPDKLTGNRKQNVKAVIETFAAKEITDKDFFEPFTITISQRKGDSTVEDEIEPGEEIDYKNPLSVNISFKVPLLGDRLQENPDAEADDIDPDTYISKGDTATFILGTGFKVNTTGPIPLPYGNYTLGHLTLSENTNGEIIAFVEFDGDQEAFTGIGENLSYDAYGDFNATLQYDNSIDNGEGREEIVTLLDYTYNVKVPAMGISYNKKKEGVLEEADKRIKWIVEIEAYKATTPDETSVDLIGYSFSDDLSNIGPYMTTPGMTVNGSSVTPTWDPTDKELSYTFPNGSIGKQTIVFYTQIEDIHYYSTSSKRFKNTAYVTKDDETVEIKTTIDVVYNPPTWITKTGDESNAETGDYNPDKRTITWNIDIDTNETTLTDAKIIDTLTGTGVSLKEASLKEWNTISEEYDTSIKTWDDTHTSNEYLLGTINGKYRLIIVVNIPNDEGGHTGTTKDYFNQAYLTWDNYPGSGSGLSSGEAKVTVGYNAISKEGVIKDSKNQVITWKIDVNTRNQLFTNLKVYDLLVYGEEGSFDLNEFSTQLTDAGVNKDHLTPKYNQKFVTGTVTHNSASFTFTPITLTKDSKPVADLLIFEGLNNPGATNGQTHIEFDAKVTNPDFFAANTSMNLHNTATLISNISGEDKVINTDTGTVSYKSQLLDKEMLKRESDASTLAGANNKTDTLSEGFDYVDKSVVYRLSVNANGLDLTKLKNADGEELGNVTVTDTLPEGWEFVPFTDLINYYIFEGNEQKTSTSVTAKGTPLTTPLDNMTPNISGGTATFTFTSLDRPYVILVKARPTPATLKTYFSPTGPTQTQNPENTLNLVTDKWAKGIEDKQKVEVKSTIIDKTHNRQEAARVEWKVTYNPYELDVSLEGITNMRIEDQMQEGMELKEDSIKVHEMTLNADGTLTENTDITSTASIEYNNALRLLTFHIPDKTKAYKLTYDTIIVSEINNEALSNTVTLYGSKKDGVAKGDTYHVQGSEASARFKFGGSVKIHKKGNGGIDLDGVTFELRKKGESTPFRTSTSKNGGKISMAVLPAGEYTLIETYAPAPYEVSKTTYKVEVREDSNPMNPPSTWIDGVQINELTVTNMQTGTIGNLIIKKTVEGNSDKNKESFNFTVTLSAPGKHPYEKSDSAGIIEDGFITSGETVSLKHDQIITVYDLPVPSTYTVEEENLSAEGYVTPISTLSGDITSPAVAEAHFINYQPGSLTIKKQVTLGDSKKPFDFTVSFIKDGIEDKTIYTYTGNNGASGGTITSGDTISLSDGQSITILGIPKDTQYEVTESDYGSEGYEEPTTSGKASDTILAGENSAVVFKNSQSLLSGLIISKTVMGSGGSKTKKFTFTVTFDNDGIYDYTGKGVPNGKIKNGDKIELADGQSISISGLLHGTQYTVTEDDYSSEGYSTKSFGSEGAISKENTAKAEFTNSRYSSGGGGGGNGGGNPKPPTPPTPTPPTPTPTPEPVNPGEVPQGYLQGPDGNYYTPQQLYDIFGQIPLGFMVGPNGMLVPLGGLPKTSDDVSRSVVVFGLLSISALLGMAVSVNNLRKKNSGE